MAAIAWGSAFLRRIHIFTACAAAACVPDLHNQPLLQSMGELLGCWPWMRFEAAEATQKPPLQL